MPFPAVSGRRRAAALLTCMLASLLPSAPAQAEGVVRGIGSPDAVPGRYIVVLRAGSAGGASMPRLAAGAAVIHRSSTGFSARLSARDARRLAADPVVAFVEQDRIVRVDGVQRNPPWGLDRIDEPTLPLSGTYQPTSAAARVHAYVIDTGIRVAHRQFGGRASYGWDFVDRDRTAGDCGRHGTHVAGTIGGSHYGVAKSVRLVAVRVLDCRGNGYLSDVIAGVDWVTAHAVKPAVANLSLGGQYSYALENAVEESIASGVTYAVAAGNDDDNACADSPAGVPAAITVGATDRRDRRAWFSNYGSCLDLFAPGVAIISASSRSNTATETMDGTSMAAPHVAGAAAMVLAANPTYTPRQVRNALVDRATTGRITDRAGSPNRLLRTAGPPAPAVIATSSLPAGVVGEAYRCQLALAHRRQGSWSLAAGALPAGLKLSAAGVLSGTPQAATTSQITIRFTDYVPHRVTRAVTVVVTPAPQVGAPAGW